MRSPTTVNWPLGRLRFGAALSGWQAVSSVAVMSSLIVSLPVGDHARGHAEDAELRLEQGLHEHAVQHADQIGDTALGKVCVAVLPRPRSGKSRRVARSWARSFCARSRVGLMPVRAEPLLGIIVGAWRSGARRMCTENPLTEREAVSAVFPPT